MKPLIFAFLALIPSVALADKNFTGGKGATWDCSKDPIVNINHGQGTYTLKGACKTINVNGGHNTLAIESVDALDINGASNTVSAGSVDAIAISGADNTITWKKSKGADGKPAISTLGQNNNVKQGK
jgi:hypothetical protein